MLHGDSHVADDRLAAEDVRANGDAGDVVARNHASASMLAFMRLDHSRSFGVVQPSRVVLFLLIFPDTPPLNDPQLARNI